MQEAFWRGRWADNKIGFHEGQANRFLSAHVGKFAPTRRVLVPLAGKTFDLAFLAGAGHEVIGVELVEDAVQAFFAEQGLAPTVQRRGPISRYTADNITLYAGDFFALGRADVGEVNAFYDRAAMIALPADLRSRYVDHLRHLLAPAAAGLLVTLEYDQTVMEGPPFSIDETMVREAWSGARVSKLERLPARNPPAVAPGHSFTEAGYWIAVGEG